LLLPWREKRSERHDRWLVPSRNRRRIETTAADDWNKLVVAARDVQVGAERSRYETARPAGRSIDRRACVVASATYAATPRHGAGPIRWSIVAVDRERARAAGHWGDGDDGDRFAGPMGRAGSARRPPDRAPWLWWLGPFHLDASLVPRCEYATTVTVAPIHRTGIVT
jgi:hypothetical protein